MLILANAGTPLIWAGLLWLLIGNFFLGFVEALILGRVVKRKCTFAGLVVANYASMFAGMGLLWLASSLLYAASLDPLGLGKLVLVGLVVATWLLTILTEWPFVARSAGVPLDLSSLKLSLTIQTLSYAGLIAVTLALGSVSAITGLRASDRVTTVAGWAYYIGLDATTVYRVRLDGSRQERVAEIEAARGFDRLIV